MKNILIVDNDEAVCEYEKNVLELSGYHVEYLRDGNLAADLIKRKSCYDLFVLSIMLPGVDGFELLRQIRQKSATPVLFVTVRSAESDMIRAFSMGADDYIKKPVSPGEFLARVGAAFSREERIANGIKYGTNRVIEMGRLRIDRFDMRVWIDGEEKDLTAREFDLLMYMVDHPNEVVTKDDLCRVLWSDEDFVSNSALPVHMLHLRRKLFDEEGGNSRYIETIRGKGYRFRA